jgi:hypothetical protein
VGQTIQIPDNVNHVAASPMREFLRVACAVVLLFNTPAAGIAWIEDRPDSLTWALRIVFPLLSMLAVGSFLVAHFRRDLASDYLYKEMGVYFNRGEFCFAFRTTAIEGIAYLEAFFQNQQRSGRSAMHH